MKVLNIDALAKPKRTLELGGVKHVVVDLTVEDFIEVTKALEELKEDDGVVAGINHTIGVLRRHVPTVSVEQFKALNLEQLGIVGRFVRGEMDDDVADTKADPAEGGPGKKQ